MANETVICSYLVRAECEADFHDVLAQHWAVLSAKKYVTDDDRLILRSCDEPPTYVEIFTWVDGGAERAHGDVDLQQIWASMGPLLEERNGRPRWDFPHFLKIDS